MRNSPHSSTKWGGEMNKILMLAHANIRKTKGQTAILAALFLISSMMLGIGLIVMFGFGSFFDGLAGELRTSDTYYYIPEALYSDEVESYFASHEEIHTYQKNRGLVMGATFLWRGEAFTNNVAIWDMDEPRDISQWKFVGDRLAGSPDAVYVPYLFKLVGGYELGDEMDILLDGKSFRFTVSGYTECIYQDRMWTGDTFLVPGQRYQELSTELVDYAKVLVFADGTDNYGKVTGDLLDLTGLSESGTSGLQENALQGAGLSGMKNSRTSMPTIVSTMLVVFTAVVAIVCLLVIRFRIGNSIEEDMQKIGSLQSIGYTSRQIALSVMAQYGVIALAASLIGVIPVYFALPFVGDIFARQSGLFWTPGIEPAINLASVAALTLIVALVALLAAVKIRQISPIRALRGGILTHSFKRNRIQLEKARMPLSTALSIKSILQNMRQSLTMFVVLVAVSFTAIIAVVMYYNAAVDLSVFEKVPGIERSNAVLIFAPDEEPEAMRAEVSGHPDVWKSQYLDFGIVRVDELDADVIIMSDFSARETVNVYEGIFPRYGNEIAIAGMMAKMTGKGIGDEVSVGPDGLPFLITGLTQGMQGGSYTVFLTLDGMRAVTPGFTQAQLNVYLDKGVSAADFVAEMESTYASRLIMAGDLDAAFSEGVSPFASIMSLVGLAVVAVAALVIVLILYFVIGGAIVRRRRELGIQKAIGFTTANLMSQISLGFALPLTLGAVAGCLFGATTVNIFMSIGMSSLGVMKASYIVNPAWVIVTGAGMIVLSYLISILITWRIRKISAFALVTE